MSCFCFRKLLKSKSSRTIMFIFWGCRFGSLLCLSSVSGWHGAANSALVFSGAWIWCKGVRVRGEPIDMKSYTRTAGFGDFRFPHGCEKCYFNEIWFTCTFEKLFFVELDCLIDLKPTQKPPIRRRTKAKIAKRKGHRRNLSPYLSRDIEPLWPLHHKRWLIYGWITITVLTFQR